MCNGGRGAFVAIVWLFYPDSQSLAGAGIVFDGAFEVCCGSAKRFKRDDWIIFKILRRGSLGIQGVNV